MIGLVDLVRGEVSGIDVGAQTGFERRPDVTEAIEIDTAEEGVVLDLLGARPAKSVLRIADQAGIILAEVR